MKDNSLEDFIESVRAQSDIVSVISGYVPLQKRGKNFWGCCPFHQEKTPSFSVSPEKGFFYCFGCQTGGNVFNFVMKIENLGFLDTVKLLAGKSNIPFPEKHKTPAEMAQEREVAQLYKVLELAKNFYQACLTKTSFGQQARDYLAKRGISKDTMEKFQLGYAPPLWDKLLNALVERGFEVEVLSKAGLIVERTSGNGFYDRFRDRIMYPINDVRGRIIGFGGRVLNEGQPKYLNSPETEIFNKRYTLYGLDKAYQSIRNSGTAIIVEGYMDVISLHAVGITNAVAALGTAFSVEQARNLRHYAKEISFAYDSDAAGQNATLRALSTVRAMGIPIKVITIPDGKDPDEFIRKHGRESFDVIEKEAISLLDYQIQFALRSYDISTLEGKVAVVSQVVPILSDVDNAVEVNYYITHLSKLLSIDESAILSEYRKYINKKDKNVNIGQTNYNKISKNSLNPACTQAERQIIRFMFDDIGLIPYVMAQLPIEEIYDTGRREIIDLVYDAYNKEKSADPSRIVHRLSDATKNELSLIMLLNSDCTDITRVVDDCLKTIHLAHLQVLYEQHRLRADELERMGDSDYLQELAESQRIKNEIKKLH